MSSDRNQPEVKEVICLRGSEERRLRQLYAWFPFLPLGQLVHIMGMSGEGKSPLTTDLMARYTTGARWPDGSANPLGPKNVITMAIEDDLHTVIMPRFDLAKGDNERFYFIKGTRVKTDTKSYDMMVALDRDWQIIADLADKIGNVGLIVIDPITNYLGKARMNNEVEVRGVLTPLASYAQKTGCEIITVGHLNKRDPEHTNPTQRGMGAAAFIGVARETYYCGNDPDNPDKHAHVMAPTRTKANPSIRYSTYAAEVELPDDKGELGMVKVVGVNWGEKVEVSAEDVAYQGSAREKTATNDAAEALRGLFSDGQTMSQKTAVEKMKELGFDLEKLNPSIVKKRAGIGKYRFWSR